MAEFFPALSDTHRAFIAKQPVYFVATTAEGTRVNLSPRGYDTVRVIDDTTVAILDLGGSGNETQAHLIADGRITIMFCAFDTPALILRIYGHGVAVLPQDDGFDALAERFPKLPGVRQVFVVAVDTVQTSCGWGVPKMTLEAERETLLKYHRQMDLDARMAKIAGRTTRIDGLPQRVQAFIPAAD